MKRLIFKRIAGSLALLFGCIVFNSNPLDAATTFSEDLFQYTVLSEEEATVELSKYNYKDRQDDNTDVVVPEQVMFEGKAYTVVQIGEWSFYYSDVTTVHLPETITSLENHAFSLCGELYSINLPTGLETIDYDAFSACIKLREMVLPSSVKYIGPYAFAWCYSLTSFHIPSSVEYLTSTTFAHNYNIVSFTVDDDNPYYSAEGPILYNKDQTTLIVYPSAAGIIEVKDGVKEISDFAFGWCDLRILTIPPSVTKLGTVCFACYDIERINCLPVTPPDLYSRWWITLDEGLTYTYCKVYVPAESLEAYKSAPVWSGHADELFPLEDTGIDSTLSQPESEDIRIYTLDGKEVQGSLKTKDLKSLDKGLYIVNGKKIMIQ